MDEFNELNKMNEEFFMMGENKGFDKDNCPNHENAIPVCTEDKKTIVFDKCEDHKEVTVHHNHGRNEIQCIGRLLDVFVPLKACPNKKVNVGVVITDKRSGKIIGQKVAQIKTNRDFSCIKDTVVGPFRFIVPEDSLCFEKRVFEIEVLLQYAEHNRKDCNNHHHCDKCGKNDCDCNCGCNE